MTRRMQCPWRSVGVIALSLLRAPPGHSQEAAATPRGEVLIKRDGYGVPHIYSKSTYGLFYGFGYALAEDHLFQMEMLRRTAAGTVAAALGAKYLDHDRRVRGNYDPDSLVRQYAALEPDERAIFDGYAAGYSARVREVLAARQQLLPREFSSFDFDPVEMTALDVLTAYAHSMALRYSDYTSEIGNLALLTELRSRHGDRDGWNIFEQIRWTHDPLAPTTVAKREQVNASPPTFAPARSTTSTSSVPVPPRLMALSAAALAEQVRLQMAWTGGVGPDAAPRASNVWIVAPAKTTQRETVLVNGPQMGNFSPGYIWAVGLHGAGFDVAGSGPMGSPWLVFGTNGRIGWGATAGGGDTVDVYQEQLNPADARQYFFMGRYRPMHKRVDTIEVKNGEPVRHEVFSTVHGLVMQFDEENHAAYSRKRSWDGSEVQSLVSWIHAMQAQSFAQWRGAIAGVTLSINNYYADAQGNIGYTFLGRFPRRPAQQDFRLPAAGTGEMEWQGFLPFESNPWVLNPEQGYIANWNNKPQPNYNSSDSTYWGLLDHVGEIDALLSTNAKLTPAELWDVNRRLSYLDNNARYFLPLVAEAAARWPQESAASRAAGMLAAWDRMTVDPSDNAKTAPAYTLFRTFLATLIEHCVGPHLPRHVYTSSADAESSPAVSPYFPTLGTKIVYNALLGSAAGVAQNFDFLGGKPRDEVLREALGAALGKLVETYGDQPAAWAEPATPHLFATLNYARVPQTTEDRELRLPAAMNRGTENNQIVLGSRGTRYCDVTPPGQSGLVWPDGSPSAHYADQLELYAKFQCKPQWLRADDVARDAKSQKVLTY